MSSKNVVKPQPSIPEELMEMMRDELQDKMGSSDAEMIRNITYAWLSEHGYLEKDADKV